MNSVLSGRVSSTTKTQCQVPINTSGASGGREEDLSR